MTIKTILFDLDGTLIDSNELIEKSFEYTFRQFGYTFSREEILQFNGPPLTETFTKINPELADEMLQTYRNHNMENHDEYVKLFPYVKETLDILKDYGIKMGVVSAKVHDGVRQGLEVTGIAPYFDTVIGVDDVENSKPHPEPVLKGMSDLKANTESSLMVGDNYHDIEAGKNAGIKTAAVAWSLKGVEYLLQFDPTYIVHHMSDLLSIVGVEKDAKNEAF
ncbi:MAG TPA: pyrophosphatase PpaX [Pseudogracilibacillus sp.]|nr:pyrophosphatase PpaX [Pseudogracilibacillus sp.]